MNAAAILNTAPPAAPAPAKKAVGEPREESEPCESFSEVLRRQKKEVEEPPAAAVATASAPASPTQPAGEKAPAPDQSNEPANNLSPAGAQTAAAATASPALAAQPAAGESVGPAEAGSSGAVAGADAPAKSFSTQLENLAEPPAEMGGAVPQEETGRPGAPAAAAENEHPAGQQPDGTQAPMELKAASETRGTVIQEKSPATGQSGNAPAAADPVQPAAEPVPAGEAPEVSAEPAGGAYAGRAVGFGVRPASESVAPRVQTLEQPVPVEQMARELALNWQHGRSTVRMQLYPRDLGAVDVRIVSGAQGLNVTIFADQAATGRMLEQQIDQLRQSFQEAGIQLNQFNVHQDSGAHTGWQQPNQTAQAHRTVAEKPAETDQPAVERRLSSGSTVDYLA